MITQNKKCFFFVQEVDCVIIDIINAHIWEQISTTIVLWLKLVYPLIPPPPKSKCDYIKINKAKLNIYWLWAAKEKRTDISALDRQSFQFYQNLIKIYVRLKLSFKHDISHYDVRVVVVITELFAM